MDLITHFPPVDHGHDVIYTVVDRLATFTYFIAYKRTVRATGLPFLFLANVIACHGMPASIVSNCDLCFTLYFCHSLISA